MGHYDCPYCGVYMCISECEEAKKRKADYAKTKHSKPEEKPAKEDDKKQ